MTDHAAVAAGYTRRTCRRQHVPAIAVGVGEDPRIAPSLLVPVRAFDHLVEARIRAQHKLMLPGKLMQVGGVRTQDRLHVLVTHGVREPGSRIEETPAALW